MIDWNTMDRHSAAEIINKMNENEEFYNEQVASWDKISDSLDQIYKEIRETLVDAYYKYKNADYQTRSSEYNLDYQMAFVLFGLLHELDFTVRDAANDEIWIYFQINVVPDIIHDRFPPTKGEERINSKRFYSYGNRNWLKILWWYVYLSWQERDSWRTSFETTKSILFNNQANDISHLVERAGTDGIRVELTREIMRQYSDYAANRSSGLADLLNQILSLNNSKTKIFDPLLSEDGLSNYVESLFREVRENSNE